MAGCAATAWVSLTRITSAYSARWLITSRPSAFRGSDVPLLDRQLELSVVMLPSDAKREDRAAAADVIE